MGEISWLVDKLDANNFFKKKFLYEVLNKICLKAWCLFFNIKSLYKNYLSTSPKTISIVPIRAAISAK